MLIRKIYEDNVIGRLPDRLFQSMLTDYENEQNELNKIIETDTADMQRIIGGQNNVERFLKLVKKYENITELTPAMINEFIDKILVHEPQGKGADRTTEVEIYLNYVGQFQVPVEQHEPTEEERIAAEKEAERLRRKRESNRKYMKKIREKSKEFAEHERNGLDYVLVGDYYVPDLKLPEEHRPIGMWGRLHRTYLEQYRPARLSALCLSGELHTYLADLNEQAAERCSLIIEQMKQAEGVTETMKADNQMLWVQSMNST